VKGLEVHHKKQQTIGVLISTLRELGYDVEPTGSIFDQLAYDETNAAKMLSISPRTLFGLRADGLIKAKQIGSRIVYSRAELLRFLESEGDS